MNILITRPLIDAEDLMGKFFAHGHKIIHLPTLKIFAIETELLNPNNFDAFVFNIKVANNFRRIIYNFFYL